jgi:hypothetical protein
MHRNHKEYVDLRFCSCVLATVSFRVKARLGDVKVRVKGRIL